MYKGENDFIYVLVFKLDHSGYVWPTPTQSRKYWLDGSQQSRWWANGCLTFELTSRVYSYVFYEKTRSEGHQYNLAYCRWSNRTVEELWRELLPVVGPLLFENQFPNSSSKIVVPLVQYTLNNNIIGRLGNRWKLTAFTALPQDFPLSSFVLNDCGDVHVHKYRI